MKGSWLWLAVGVAAFGAVADAHHSISSIYDSSQRVTIEAVVTRFLFVNPHPFVMVTVTDDGGRTEEWRLELDNRAELATIGVAAETLKPGDRVQVSGSRARDKSRGLYVWRLDRPADGFWYEQVGSSPRIGARH